MGDVVTLVDGVERIGIPGIIILVLVLLVYKLYPFFVDCLKAYKKSKDVRAESDIKRAQAEFERNEIQRQQIEALRQSSAVIENCTEVIKGNAKIYERETERISRELADHEAASQERDLRTERKQDDIIGRVGNIQGSLGEIKQIVKLTA